ncbi:wax ester/triacylglycerol synthase family O-acyltransferase [Pontixanthobacter aestiaquae]|uniref:diacylglycerol O-acyltransferase n=1 Tax=Pontixanthobacter aestiaquae TaxID=1509367 RepID=A0A844Z798_9SPHN|nr:wax ester/triacylglycerol synthase family O-acyltransferase [Pontixanthobacter aestiaquae]MDN3645880.1 wax ester/triacylglycerol synthase family O-acyltransferase [Pontixanthobacter aestiaquae]MXO83126.1 wax ester/triacylglycerol synthase family O-acyltransferase [Pontixanthobacter aestiaquae]
MDASFVALETRNSPMHIGSILIYNPETAPGGFVRYKDILGFFKSRMQLSRTIRQRLVKVPFDLDYPYWVEDPDFDLEYHVRHIALPKPGDWRQLCIQAARIFARPLDLKRPPWEFTIVEGLDNVPGVAPGSFAMVTKVHHAAIDGMSGVDLLEAMHTITPDAPPPDTPDTWKPEKIPNPAELLGKSYISALTNPLKQLEVAAKAAPGIANAIKGLATKDFKVSADMVAPKCRFNRTISPARVVEGRSVPLADIKAIRALSPGCKINDVFLAIVGGALRRYLLSKNDLPGRTLTAMAPISVRSKDEKGDMGNQVAAMVAPLGTQLEDPVERLDFVHDKTANSKAMTEAMGARNMTEMSKVSPALFMALGAQLYTRLGLADRVSAPFSTVVTNVPGPPVPIYSSGARLESQMGLVCLTDGMGLGHVVQSYVNEATISFTACRDLLPDPEYYAECIQESFEEYRDLAAKADAPPKTPTAKQAAPKKRPVKKAAAKKKAPTQNAAPKKTTAKRATTGKSTTKTKGGNKTAAKAKTTRRRAGGKANK